MTDFEAKCIKFDFRWSSAPHWGAYWGALYLRGILLRRGREKGKRKERREREGKGRKGWGERPYAPLSQILCYATART